MTDPEEIRKLLLQVIRDKINNHPRSQQLTIGPSEIGHPCDRWMTYKLLDGRPPSTGPGRDKWRPTVGTAVHSWLDEAFQEFNEKVGAQIFHGETRVNVGTVHGPGEEFDVEGSCDLYVNGVVVDWKIVGKWTLQNARRSGPGQQYRTQVHNYGRGHLRAGRPVTHVAVFFLPASGTLDESVWWCEPFDEQVAIDGLQRVSRIYKLVAEHGRRAPALAEKTAHHCAAWCEWWRPRAKDPSTGCTGVIPPSAADSVLPID